MSFGLGGTTPGFGLGGGGAAAPPITPGFGGAQTNPGGGLGGGGYNPFGLGGSTGPTIPTGAPPAASPPPAPAPAPKPTPTPAPVIPTTPNLLLPKGGPVAPPPVSPPYPGPTAPSPVAPAPLVPTAPIAPAVPFNVGTAPIAPPPGAPPSQPVSSPGPTPPSLLSVGGPGATLFGNPGVAYQGPPRATGNTLYDTITGSITSPTGPAVSAPRTPTAFGATPFSGDAAKTRWLQANGLA